MIIRTSAYARVGLVGNPSDGYFGKTIAAAITNFSANVTLWETPRLYIRLHPTQDPTEFDSLEDLWSVAQRDYYGGHRLILASCKKFYEYCEQHAIPLPLQNFTVSYDSDIPRQLGLGGSSAIITATINALIQFYGLDEETIPKPVLPNLILSVETEELGIAAGLQDRVIQTYGGTVYMDFSKELMETQGHGHYEPLDSNLLPNLFLAYYAQEASESGKIHNDVRHRYENGDPEVIDAMQTFAHYTDEAKVALERHDYESLGQIMNQNFDLRRKIFGDAVIGERNLEMIHIAREMGHPAKFSGSSGAIIGICESWDQLRKLARCYRERGFGFVKLSIDPGY